MSGLKLEEFTNQFLKNGIDTSKGIAIIQQATTPEQKTTVFSFEELKYKTLPEFEHVPTLIIVGKVVNLHQKYAWIEEKQTPFSSSSILPSFSPDAYGWKQNHEGNWFYTLFVENGVVKPYQKEFLLQIAQLEISNFIFTCNQNLILGEISQENKSKIENLIEKFAIEKQDSVLRKNSMACVALPTCPLALAEAQRYLPKLVSKIEPLLEKYNLQEEEISIRMTGCPNGCGRSYVSELGFVGTAPEQYNFMIGGDRYGERLNQLYKEKLSESEILTEIDSLFYQYVNERKPNENFGDFSYRKFFSAN